MTLIVSISEQAQIFLAAVEAGIIIGIFYDLFRIIRKILPHPNWVIQLEDFIFWIIVSGFMFFVLFSKNYGEIRGFALIGAFLGNMIYFFTLSIWLMKFSDWIIDWIKRIIRVVIRILLIPIKLIIKILYYPYKWISYPMRILGVRTKILVHKSKSRVKRKSRQMLRELYIIYKKV